MCYNVRMNENRKQTERNTVTKQLALSYELGINEDVYDALKLIVNMSYDDFKDIAFLELVACEYDTPVFQYTSISIVDSLNNIRTALDGGNIALAKHLIASLKQSISGRIPELDRLEEIVKFYGEVAESGLLRQS